MSYLTPGQFFIIPIREIGSGGLGTVDEVRVIDSNQSHPIGTVLARKRLNSRWALDPGTRQQFEQEIQILSTMRHRGVMSVKGENLPGGERFYVMPLYQHGSLRGRMQAPHRLDIRTIAEVGEKIANALAYAHAMGFFHRDLKPENILISDAGEPIVADWGLGQFVHRQSRVLDVSRAGPMGAAYYCSLEQWSTGQCDATGDIYSLGVILAELALGFAPLIHPIGTGIQTDVYAGNSQGELYFNALVKTMTALVPSRRPQSMADVAYQLQWVRQMV